MAPRKIILDLDTEAVIERGQTRIQFNAAGITIHGNVPVIIDGSSPARTMQISANDTVGAPIGFTTELIPNRFIPGKGIYSGEWEPKDKQGRSLGRSRCRSRCRSLGRSQGRSLGRSQGRSLGRSRGRRTRVADRTSTRLRTRNSRVPGLAAVLTAACLWQTRRIHRKGIGA